jgi:hypothetical protein
MLAAAARWSARFGDRCDYTGSPELLGDLVRAVDWGAAGEIAGNAARSGDVPSGGVLGKARARPRCRDRRRGAGARGNARAPRDVAFRPENVSDWPCSSEVFSKNLNKSAPSDE